MSFWYRVLRASTALSKHRDPRLTVVFLLFAVLVQGGGGSCCELLCP